jgi:hypothetical protein
MDEPKRKVKHQNPYDHGTEKHALFEAAWSKKTAWGNFKGMWTSGREDRQARVQQRVESFTTHRDAFVGHNDLPLQPSYHPERDQPNHPYTGMRGKGEPVKYLDHSQDERYNFAVSFDHGQLQQKGIKNSQGEVVPPDRVGDKVMFTRRASNAGQLLAMIKSTKPERVQHSTFNEGMEVANAGFINLDHAGQVDSFKLSSGHYAPDVESGVKLAMWSEQHGVFQPGQARIQDHSGKPMDTSIQARMFAVQSWATRQNL